MSVRARRLENEWTILGTLAERHPAIVGGISRESLPDGDVFRLRLHRTSALSFTPPHAVMEFATHAVTLRYPPFFPGVPIEAFLAEPVFHPNVHPENGFVCLWERFATEDTVTEAIRKLQRVVAWELWNSRHEHVMQPEALKHAEAVIAPLPFDLLPLLEQPQPRLRPPARPRLSK